ncbi:glycosyltransferase [Natronomonas sp. EA1]|uniref:glycosyltransferase n=1 Tax=Natronomonas sp. EA1 TaxID=3421655 RepID=UPI003EBFAD33
MRVALVAHETTHRRDRQGLARVETVAEALAGRGHEVALFCSQWWADHQLRHDAERVSYRAATVAPATTSFCARLPFLIARFRPDVVHATPAPPVSVLAASAGATLSRAPLIVDWYGDEPVAGARTLERASKTPDTVVTPSRHIATRVQNYGASSPEVIPEWVEFDRIRGTDPTHEADIVAGRRLDEDANLESLLLALAEHRRHDWSCTVFGDGPAREAYEQQASDLRIGDRVTFAGRASREERIAAYRGAHVFVHTAKKEEFATELLWALACGCVGIVEYQADSAAHELVERRDRGFRATTPEEIEEAIVDAGDLSEQTIDEALLPFDRENVLEQYLDCYRDAGA